MGVIRLAALAMVAACNLLAVNVPLTAPSGFEENKGQFPSKVQYALRPSVYLTSNSLEFSPQELSMQFGSSNFATALVPADTLPYTVNVYSGSNAFTGIRRFGQIRYANLYPGIDLVFSLETFFTFRFILQPGADVSAIRLNYSGGQVTGGFADNQLLLLLPPGRYGQNSTAYQDTGSGRIPVGVHYTNLGDSRFGFELDAYDTTNPVIIETTLPIGQNAVREPSVLSSSGAIYEYGQDYSITDTCGLDSFGVPAACSDAALYRYSSSGALTWITYLSGSSNDKANAITVAPNDFAYIAGNTASADFPTGVNATQRTYAGPPPQFGQYPVEQTLGDAFVAKIDRDGHLLYSTYIGGPLNDSANLIHIDASGSAYIAGPCSNGLPVTAGVLKTTPCTSLPYPSFPVIGYLARLDPAGRLAFLTYLPETLSQFVVDPDGNAYLGGRSNSGSAYVAKLDPNGAALTYSLTYTNYGATRVESLALDSSRNLWFDGPSETGGNPYTGYLAKLSADGSKILYETPFISGELEVDASGDLDVLSRGGAATVHTPGGVLTSQCAPSSTLSLLDPSGIVLLNRPAPVNGPIGLSNGFLLGSTTTTDQIAIVRIEPASLPDAGCVLNAASLSIPNVIAPGEIITLFGLGVGPAAGQIATLDASGRLPDSVGGVRVLFDGVPAPMLYADSGQVNAIAPYSLTPGSTTTVQVETQGSRTSAIVVTVKDTVPSLFTLDGSGQGRVLAFNQDGTLNSPANPAKLGSIVTMFATGTGVTSPASEAGAIAESIDARPVQVPPVVLYGIRGGFPLDVLYAGPSPGSLTSVTQLNLRLPDSLASADTSYSLSAWPLAFLDTALEFTTISLAP